MLTSKVEAAEALDDGRHQRVDLVGVADVGGDEHASRPPATMGSSGSLRPHDHDVGAGLEEAVGDAPADALGAAGHEDDAAAQVEGVGEGDGHRVLLQGIGIDAATSGAEVGARLAAGTGAAYFAIEF